MFHDTQPAALDDEGGLDAWAQFRVDDASEVLHLLQLLRDRSAPLGLSSPQGVAVSSRLDQVRYDIRGPLSRRAHELEAAGTPVLRLNIGNPGLFALAVPEPSSLALLLAGAGVVVRIARRRSGARS